MYAMNRSIKFHGLNFRFFFFESINFRDFSPKRENCEIEYAQNLYKNEVV